VKSGSRLIHGYEVEVGGAFAYTGILHFNISRCASRPCRSLSISMINAGETMWKKTSNGTSMDWRFSYDRGDVPGTNAMENMYSLNYLAVGGDPR